MKKLLNAKNITTAMAIAIVLLESGIFTLNDLQTKIAYVIVGILGVYGYSFNGIKEAIDKAKKK